MKDLGINISFIPDLNAVQYDMPMEFKIFDGSELKKIGGVIFEGISKGRPHILIDKNATKKETQSMIAWVRRVLNRAIYDTGTYDSRVSGAQISVIWEYGLPKERYGDGC